MITMQQYLSQLIADITETAATLPAKPCYDIPPEAEDIEYVLEWENATVISIQKWIGIAKENFPPPVNLPAKIANKMLVVYFNRPVAWISEGTLHVQFWGTDPKNCSVTYKFCMCKDFDKESDIHGLNTSNENAAEIAILRKEINEIENKNEVEFLPKKAMVRYVEQLLDDMRWVTDKTNSLERFPGNIAIGSSQSGRELLNNPFVTLEELSSIKFEQLPDWLEDLGSREDVVDKEWEEMYTFEKWERVITIEPSESHELFRIMEDFAEYKVPGNMHLLLFDALSRRKLFGNFKNLIHQSDYEQEWYNYKQRRLEARVWALLPKGLLRSLIYQL